MYYVDYVSSASGIKYSIFSLLTQGIIQDAVKFQFQIILFSLWGFSIMMTIVMETEKLEFIKMKMVTYSITPAPGY